MTIREAIFIIKRLFREVNADSRLTNKAIFSLLNKHSKWLIYRDSERLKLLKKNNVYQKLKCLDVEEVSRINCNIDFKGETIFRTKDKLPEIFEDSHGVIIGNITSIDSNVQIKLTTYNTTHRKKDNPWLKNKSKNTISVYFDDGYLYFTDKHIKKIEVEAFFTKEVDEDLLCKPCKDCESQSSKCKKYLDTKFIIPDYLEAQLMDSVIKDLSNTYKRLPEKSEEIDKNDSNPK